MQRVLIMYCFICNVCLLCGALYAKVLRATTRRKLQDEYDKVDTTGLVSIAYYDFLVLRNRYPHIVRRRRKYGPGGPGGQGEHPHDPHGQSRLLFVTDSRATVIKRATPPASYLDYA